MLYVATEIPQGATSPRFTLVNGYYVISHTPTLASAIARHASPFFVGEWGYEELLSLSSDESVPVNRAGKLVHPDQLIYDHAVASWCIIPSDWVDVVGLAETQRFATLPPGASVEWGIGYGRQHVPYPSVARRRRPEQRIPAEPRAPAAVVMKKVDDLRARKVRIRKGE